GESGIIGGADEGACYCPRYAGAQQRRSRGEIQLVPLGLSRASTWPVRPGRTDGRAGAKAEAAMDAIWAELSASGSVPVTPWILNPRRWFLPGEAAAGRSLAAAVTAAVERVRRELGIAGGGGGKDINASTLAGPAAPRGVSTLFVVVAPLSSISADDAWGPADSEPWSSGLLLPPASRDLAVVVVAVVALRWWWRRGEKLPAGRRPFFSLRGSSCQSAGSERGRGARLPHTNRARRAPTERRARNPRRGGRTDARRNRLPPRAHAPEIPPPPDWLGAT
ncbi:unnamed protein product, partial [Ixodes hexagonus]